MTDKRLSLSVRLPRSLHAKVLKAAQDEGLTLNAYMTKYLRAKLEPENNLNKN